MISGGKSNEEVVGELCGCALVCFAAAVLWCVCSVLTKDVLELVQSMHAAKHRFAGSIGACVFVFVVN